MNHRRDTFAQSALLFTSEARIPNKVPMQAHSLENLLQESGNVLPSDAKEHKKTELPTH
jgi:hypothetical protein